MENLICICDDCRAVAAAGDPPFASFGDLLDFEPVPRRKARADGWDADCQRAFIAALAVCGSKRQAAHAVGKAQFGVEQLLKHEGSAGFAAACERAIALHAETGRHRRVRNVAALAGEAERRSRGPLPAWSGAASRRPQAVPSAPPPAKDDSDDTDWESVVRIVENYLIKLGQERQARLAGEIVAADFYLRQATHIEVMLDLAGTGGFFALMRRFRELDPHLVAIAETPVSRLLDEARRAKWAELGEPMRPAPPPRDLLVDHGEYSTEPLECTWGGRELSHDEQRARFGERHRRDAREQVAWELRAREEAAAWRARLDAEEEAAPAVPNSSPRT